MPRLQRSTCTPSRAAQRSATTRSRRAARPRHRSRRRADLAIGEAISPMAAIGAWVCALVRANPGHRFRVGNPDELKSNGMGGTLDLLKHRANRPEPGNPEAVDGAVITALNEEAVIGAALGNKGAYRSPSPTRRSRSRCWGDSPGDRLRTPARRGRAAAGLDRRAPDRHQPRLGEREEPAIASGPDDRRGFDGRDGRRRARAVPGRRGERRRSAASRLRRARNRRLPRRAQASRSGRLRFREARRPRSTRARRRSKTIRAPRSSSWPSAPIS